MSESAPQAGADNPAGVPWPIEIRVIDDGHALKVAFEDGASFTLPAEYLRVESPSAEVQGHHPTQKVTVPGKRAVRIVQVEPVGNYAVRLLFDDRHGTGIYTWTLLYEYGVEQEQKFGAYLAEMEKRGLSRG